MHSFIIKSVVVGVLVLFLSWLYLFMPQRLFLLDNYLRDFLFMQQQSEKKVAIKSKNPKIIIVDIDEKSLQKYGQWPWPRKLIAKLLYNLTQSGVGIVGLDIVFVDNDRSSPHRLSKIYPNLKIKLENYDELLAQCFMQTPVIGGFVFDTQHTTQYDAPSIEAIVIDRGDASKFMIEAKGIYTNIPLLQNALYSSGFFNIIPDDDGLVRRAPLVMSYDSVVYPSLALEMFRIYSGAKTIELQSDPLVGISSVKIANEMIPVDAHGRFNIHFREGKKSFHYISASNILENNFDKKEIEGSFVLVGTSAVGLHDLRSNLYDLSIPGVEIHANIIDNILKKDFIYKPANIVSYDLVILWSIVVVSMLLFSYIRSWLMVVGVGVTLYSGVYVFSMLLFEEGIMLNLFFPLVAFVLTLVSLNFIDFLSASKQKEEAKRMLGKKVSPAVMEYLLEHSNEELVASKEVEATILFSDIRGFTTLSEKVGSPDKLIKILNHYMTPMVENIISHRGTIDKFIGDAIMAYWNAPVKVENHTDEAVTSAIQQIELLDKINEHLQKEYGVSIAIGIGIHLGVVTAGDMGAEGRSDYTIIGDNVNLASRLEGLTKLYGAQIIISKECLSSLKKSYTMRVLDFVEVKGKSEAVEIFEIITSKKDITQKELDLYPQALEAFREQQLQKAHKLFTELESITPSKLYQHYLVRIEEFLQDPQKEFTTTYVMHSK